LGWVKHCRAYAEQVIDALGLGPRSRVLEIGSNDGTMLRGFRDHNIPAVGVEPCEQLAEYAQVEGLATVCTFWSEAFARGMAQNHKPTPGYADLVIANNVLAHVPDLLDFLRGVKVILAPGGVATFEVPHIAHLIENAAFDQVYAEHHCYFSLHSLAQALGQAGLDVQDVEEIPTHGGSLRIWVRPYSEEWETTDRARLVYQDECDRGLDRIDTYLAFASRPPEVKRRALAILGALEGKRVVAYGASAKATTMLNYLGVGSEWIQAIGDVTSAKRGKYLPGVRIPVVSEDQLQRLEPDVIVNMLWNWRAESEARLRELLPGTPIVYLNESPSTHLEVPGVEIGVEQ